MEIEEQNMKIPAGGAVSLVVDGGALVICSMKQGHTVFLQHAANPLLLRGILLVLFHWHCRWGMML
jgi:hypothetical protein